MLALKPFISSNWKYFDEWITDESELIQFAGQIFTFPITKKQIETYLNDTSRTVFLITFHNKPIGISEIYLINEKTVKFARILIGEKSMRGKGIGTELINILVKFSFEKLKRERIILNVYSWNINAIKCYEKVGFSKTSKPIKTIQVENKNWKTIEMEKLSK